MTIVENSHPSGRDCAIQSVIEILSLKVNFGDFDLFAHFDFSLKDPEKFRACINYKLD
jgi:hypothetical protein